MVERAVISELQMMVLSRLFGEGMWLADRDSAEAIDRRLHQLGLHETVPEDTSLTRSTTLGRELNLDLMMVFLGLWDEHEIPGILMSNKLIDEYDLDEIYNRMERDFDPEILLLPIVQKAYFNFNNASGPKN